MPKRRTREHIIADLSVNHFERHALRCGHTVQRIQFDYGYDLFLQTFDSTGDLEPGYVLIQMKASDSPNWLLDRLSLAVVLSREDLETWAIEINEVVLVQYDASEDRAYWLALSGARLEALLRVRTARTITIHIPRENVVDDACVQIFRDQKRLRIQAMRERSL